MGMGGMGMAGGLVGTGLQMYGQYQAGKQAKAAAAYNNKLAQIEARNIENESMESTRRTRISQRGNLAKMRVAAANSGVQSNTGLPVQLISEAAGRMEIEVADAARKANMQAASVRDRGRMAVFEAKQFAAGQKLNMLGTAISGAANFSGQAQTGKHYGVF